MAKKKNASTVWDGDSRDTALNNMFGDVLKTARDQFGGTLGIGADAWKNMVGLDMPSLCLRYLFQSTVFPLSRIIQITGEEGSAKSAFLYELFRWHMMYGGGAVLAENENKDSPELRDSLLEWKQNWLHRLIIKPTHTLEQWQDVFTAFLKQWRELMDAKGGPGRTIPICIAVDSIMATAPQAEIDAVRSDGHASRGYALAANLIARYMRTLPEQLQLYPITLAGTNHLKPSTDMRGLPTANIPGGKSVKFMETYEIKMKRLPRHDIELLDYSGLRVSLRSEKNSLGPSRKQISAELLWWYTPDERGIMRQQTAWDWHTASIELLMSFETAKGKKTIFKELQNVTGIRVESKSARTAYSPLLGISKGSAVPYRVLGAKLEEHPEILQQVYNVLGIQPRQRFMPGEDYRKMIEDAQRDGAISDAATLYPLPENLPTLVPQEEIAEVPPEADEEEEEGETK